MRKDLTCNPPLLASQTGAFLNGYVSCKVKRWYSFHKFLVESFLGYRPRSEADSSSSRCDRILRGGDSEAVPPPPPSPSTARPPEGQGIKATAAVGGHAGGSGEKSCVRGGAADKDESEMAYTVQEVVDAMPVVLFLHVVGCGECVPELDELLARDAKVSDCPPEVRKLLFRQHDSNAIKMVRHRVKETLAALETIGVTRTALSGDDQADVALSAPPDEARGEDDKTTEGTVHSATSFTVRRRVAIVLPSSEGHGGRHSKETFVFEQEDDVDNFWRALAVRSRTHMQPNTSFIKPERGDEYNSEDAGDARWGEGEAQGEGGGREVTLFEKFPMLLKRKTWNNLAFGDCTAAQRESVASLLKRERMAAADQVCPPSST